MGYKVIDLLDNIELLVENHLEVGFSKRTRLSLFVPRDYIAVCYNLQGTGEDGTQLSQTNRDVTFSLEVIVIDKAEPNQDTTSFIEMVEGLRENLRKTGDLNSRALFFNMEIDYRDRGMEDNFENIAIMTINGHLAG